MNYTWQLHTIVNHGLGERIARETREAGARGGTILVGRGSAHQTILQLLALSDVEKDVLITLVTDEQYEAVLHAIRNSKTLNKKNRGILYAIPLCGGKQMSEESNYELITIITNRGYADDIMAAARKAGARGGTILHARGTGTEGDATFFGITVVPEKEQVLILADGKTASNIKKAIASLPCLNKPGVGIMYATPVASFEQLGNGQGK